MKRRLVLLMGCVLAVGMGSVLEAQTIRGGTRSGTRGTRGGSTAQPEPSSQLPNTTSIPQIDPATPLREISVSAESLDRQIAAIEKVIAETAPNRELKVRKTDAQKLKLTSPKLIDQKFVAVMTLSPPSLKDESLRQQFRFYFMQTSGFVRERLPAAVTDFMFGRNGVYLLSINDGGSGIFGGRGAEARSENREFFKALYEQSPADKRPRREVVETFLAAESANWGVRHQTFDPTDNAFARTWTITIFAPSAEAAEERARAVIGLVDEGFSTRLQKMSLETARALADEAKTAIVNWKQKEAEFKAAREALSKPTEAPSEIMADLRSQRVSVTVELAGLSARIRACDEMLAKSEKLPPETLRSVGDVKVRAEIERAGVREKLDRITAFIKEGEERVKLVGASSRIRRESNQIARDLEEQSALIRYREIFAAGFAPFSVKDNEIVISPIEWTE